MIAAPQLNYFFSILPLKIPPSRFKRIEHMIKLFFGKGRNEQLKSPKKQSWPKVFRYYTFCKKHLLIICTELLLAQIHLEALKKAPSSSQFYIATSAKLNILILKHNTESWQHELCNFLKSEQFVHADIWNNVEIKTKGRLSWSLYFENGK